MSTKTKSLVLLIAVQTGSLAVGLWMHHRIAVSTVVRNADVAARRDLERRGAGLLAKLSPEISTDGSTPPGRSAVAAALTGDAAVVGRAVITDALGIPVWVLGDDRRTRNDAARAQTLSRASLTWRPIPRETQATSVGSTWGEIALDEGDHLAVAFDLADGERLILHRSAERVHSEAMTLTRSLSVVSVMTLVWIVALLGIAVYVVLTRVHDQMERERLCSATETLRHTQDLVRTRDAVIFGLAKLADSRDPETGDHLERISVYSTTLASALRRHPEFADKVSPAFVRLIGISSALHDIGKVGVADSILLKPGPLTASEREAMQLHTAIGGDCLRELERRLGNSNFLQMAREIAYAHHENWDGLGYPNGLSGEQIPLAARIVAIADVYDALSSRRVYKKPMSHRKCMQIIQRKAGKKFDPLLVEIWLTVESKFESVAKQFAFRSGEELPDDEPEIAAPEYGDKRKVLCPVGAGVPAGLG